MALFSELRTTVLLRRIAIALERMATAQEAQARFSQEADDRRVHEGYRPRPKQVIIDTFDQTAANRYWRQMQIDSGRRTAEDLEEEFGPLPDR